MGSRSKTIIWIVSSVLFFVALIAKFSMIAQRQAEIEEKSTQEMQQEINRSVKSLKAMELRLNAAAATSRAATTTESIERR